MSAAFKEIETEFEIPQPHSVEAEQMVLGSILLGAPPPNLMADDFFRPDHQLIWTAIETLRGDGKALDAVLVFGELERTGKVADAGGLAYLKTLTDQTPTPATIAVYVEKVRREAKNRQLLSAGARIQWEIAEGASPADIAQALQPLLDQCARTDTSAWSAPQVYSYGADFDAAKIPLRQWMLGQRRALGEVTCDAGPPGVNKSSLQLSDAIQIVTGRSILADQVHMQGEVLYLAGEDSRRDVEARIAGILQRHHIRAAELAGKLHVIYLHEIEVLENYTLARMVDDLAILNVRMLAWLRDLPNVVAVFIDPIAVWHQLIENSNEAFGVLTNGLKSLAVQGKRHVGFDHHVTKASMTDPEAHVHNLAALRGAGVIGAAARWAFTLAKLRPDTAAQFGIPENEHWRYRRLDPLKASYGEDDGPARLLKVEGVRIANGETVGVLVEVDLKRSQAEAAERKSHERDEWEYDFICALVAMLEEKGPCSQRDAATWFFAQRPKLFPGRGGEPLSINRIREKLPALVGGGLQCTVGGTDTRIITRSGKRNSLEIAFEEPPK